MKNLTKRIVITVVILLIVCFFIPAGYLASAVWIKSIGIRILPDTVHKPQKVQFFLQNDQKWKDDLLGNSGQNLAQVGCLVSVLASDIDYLGYKTNPADLNRLFIKNGVYTQNGEVIWHKINEAIPGIEYSYMRVFTSRILENDLKNGRLPIVKVRYKKTGIFHWVLIIGSDNEDFLIMDPLNQTQKPIRLGTHGRVYAYRVLSFNKPQETARNIGNTDVVNSVYNQETLGFQEVISPSRYSRPEFPAEGTRVMVLLTKDGKNSYSLTADVNNIAVINKNGEAEIRSNKGSTGSWPLDSYERFYTLFFKENYKKPDNQLPQNPDISKNNFARNKQFYQATELTHNYESP